MSQPTNSMLKKSFRLRQLCLLSDTKWILQNCQRRVESRHPQQVPHRLIGPRALLIAAELKHAMGVPYRKVATVLKRLCGLSVTAGALAPIHAIVGKMVHSRISSNSNRIATRVIAPMSMKPAGG